jgi:hypothetical protein
VHRLPLCNTDDFSEKALRTTPYAAFPQQAFSPSGSSVEQDRLRNEYKAIDVLVLFNPYKNKAIFEREVPSNTD